MIVLSVLLWEVVCIIIAHLVWLEMRWPGQRRSEIIYLFGGIALVALMAMVPVVTLFTPRDLSQWPVWSRIALSVLLFGWAALFVIGWIVRRGENISASRCDRRLGLPRQEPRERSRWRRYRVTTAVLIVYLCVASLLAIAYRFVHVL